MSAECQTIVSVLDAMQKRAIAKTYGVSERTLYRVAEDAKREKKKNRHNALLKAIEDQVEENLNLLERAKQLQKRVTPL